jgi:ATP-binding cassette subfamily C protein LapB
MNIGKNSTGIDVMSVTQDQINDANEVERISSHEEDLDLSKILARIALLKGLAIPVHRFSMLAVTSGGAVIQDMQRNLRAAELWESAVPNGNAYTLGSYPDKDSLPVLWISFDSRDIRLIRGKLANGGYSTELPDGSFANFDPADFLKGNFLALEIVSDQYTAKLIEPKSARDWFYHAIKKRYAPFAEAVFATAFMSVLALTASFYTMQVYDRVVPNQGFSTLTVLTVGALIAISLELLMKYLRSKIVDIACKEIDQELSGVFFGQVLDIRMDARPKSVGTFASQVKNFEIVRNFMTSSTLFIFADAPFVIFFIGIIALVGGWIAFVPLMLLPISIIIGFYSKWKIGRLAENQLSDANKKNGMLVEAIDGIEAIKAVGGEWKLLNSWRQITAENAQRELSIRSISTMATNATQSVQQISYVLMIGAGVYAISSGSITMGALIACSIISNRALGPLAQISGLIVQWQLAKSALQGLDQIMALPRDKQANTRMVIPEAFVGLVNMENAGFSYSKDKVALQSSSLLINPGEKVAVIGAVGSGKSTLIKLLSMLYKPSEGRVFLDGVDASQIAPEFLREHIGYLTQDVRLFNGTLRDNLTMGLPMPADAQILEAASLSGLSKVIQASPQGLEHPIFEGGRGLSGGQRQLVGLTRLLIARPKLLLLDEPTASMDGDLESHVMNSIFNNLAINATIVLATHKMSLLKLVDRIVIMGQGKIIVDGPRDEVLAQISGGKVVQSSSSLKSKSNQIMMES